jgi:hypothetical protein
MILALENEEADAGDDVLTGVAEENANEEDDVAEEEEEAGDDEEDMDAGN